LRERAVGLRVSCLSSLGVDVDDAVAAGAAINALAVVIADERVVAIVGGRCLGDVAPNCKWKPAWSWRTSENGWFVAVAWTRPVPAACIVIW
jgi:hypothetical protein